ncbi:DUF2891 domain-containing protein [Halomarina oriensis]|uniref:DUF2891 family protein n=1 Tax=Halomarina oriensis TaxID=671145 RepID=A0A6B0GT41_9EURY|nr:DUF2891 domain-containing protein [Halomarina oriensis]MWG35843.1 DUF2891 family protein [Halomarina oriensis]
MHPLDAADTAAVCSGRSGWAGPAVAEALAHAPLDAIDTEYPHDVHAVESPDSVPVPSEQHPVFFGCYDWHSAVHSHWALVRQLRLFEDHPDETAIVRSIDDRLTDATVAREVAYFDEHESFEKPYGWAWLLHLAAELRRWDDERADRWSGTLEPLEARVVDLVEGEFLPQNRAFRVGTHGNTAFALHCVLDYARSVGNGSLESAVVDTSLRLFEDDTDYPVEYEPLGWDFLSPALTEADLLRRILDREAFTTWVERFFPEVTDAPYSDLLSPVGLDDDSGGVALHLVGLNLSKAWAMAGLADTLGDHRYAGPFERAAQDHAAAGIDHAFTDDYAGSHWLSSFVLYLLTRNEGGIAPA